MDDLRAHLAASSCPQGWFVSNPFRSPPSLTVRIGGVVVDVRGAPNPDYRIAGVLAGCLNPLAMTDTVVDLWRNVARSAEMRLAFPGAIKGFLQRGLPGHLAFYANRREWASLAATHPTSGCIPPFAAGLAGDNPAAWVAEQEAISRSMYPPAALGPDGRRPVPASWEGCGPEAQVVNAALNAAAITAELFPDVQDTHDPAGPFRPHPFATAMAAAARKVREVMATASILDGDGNNKNALAVTAARRWTRVLNTWAAEAYAWTASQACSADSPGIPNWGDLPGARFIEDRWLDAAAAITPEAVAASLRSALPPPACQPPTEGPHHHTSGSP